MQIFELISLRIQTKHDETSNEEKKVTKESIHFLMNLLGVKRT